MAMVSGVVICGTHNVPVNCEVENDSNGEYTWTDCNNGGAYSIDALPNQVNTIWCKPTGHNKDSVEIFVPAGGLTGVDLRPTHRQGIPSTTSHCPIALSSTGE